MGKRVKKKIPASEPTGNVIFNPSFRDRWAYSVGKSIDSAIVLNQEIRRGDPNPDLIGMEFLDCYKRLSNGIEMLCKAVIEKQSKFLLLRSLSSFDLLHTSDEDLEEISCGAASALARASKFFKKNLSSEELGRLNSIFEVRNGGEHRDLEMFDFESELGSLASVFALIVEVADAEFGMGSSMKDMSNYLGYNLQAKFTKLVDENSTRFEEINLIVEARKKDGEKFIICANCFFGFAELTSDQNAYHCLWCDDVRVRRECSSPGCRKVFWALSNSEQTQCDGPHMIDFFNMTLEKLRRQNSTNPWLGVQSAAAKTNFDSALVLNPANSANLSVEPLSPLDGLSAEKVKTRESILSEIRRQNVEQQEAMLRKLKTLKSKK